MNGNRARAAIVIAVIVVGSALAGAGASHWYMLQHRPRPMRGSSTPEQDAKRRKEMLDRMTKDLDLSAPQRAGIDSVMQRTDSSLRVVRAEMQPRIRHIFEASRAEIGARLDSTQRAKFEKQNAERRKH